MQRIFNVLLVAASAWAVYRAAGWRPEVALFPLFAAVLAGVFALAQLLVDVRKAGYAAAAPPEGPAGAKEPPLFDGSSLAYFASLIVVLLLGIPAGLTVVLLIMSRFIFRESWLYSILLALAGLALMLGLFGSVFAVSWPEPLMLMLWP